ncbi:hypothetical protein A8B75_04305 [Sphingomonadales bacterium EhC05]|nr:hypothetical protein A8B75_04305 [Sphingomonadales bacterium EhC05]
MTLFEPTISVRRLVVYRNLSEVYSCEFHDGVNILSGENSSGKSTIISFLVYCLGGDIHDWSEHARLCDRVAIEVQLNHHIVTVMREISTKAGQPMMIFPGDLDSSIAAPMDDWRKYPYRTTSSKESFSQAIFTFLNIPELEMEMTGKITLHQLLRLIYSDQLSSIERIFRDDSWDTPELREAVGRLLIGAYEPEIYTNQLKLRQLNKELQEIRSALRSLYLLLSGYEHSLTLDWVDAEKAKLASQLTKLQEELRGLEILESSDEGTSDFTLDPQTEEFESLQKIQKELGSARDQQRMLELEYSDSEIFLTTIEHKIDHLRDANNVASLVSELKYARCPSCYAPIKATDDEKATDDDVCRLCKEPFDHERMKSRAARQLNDLISQHKQSLALQADRIIDIKVARERAKKLIGQWTSTNENLVRLRSSPTSRAREQAKNLNEQVGYLKRELEDVDEKANLIGKLDELSKRQDQIKSDVSEIEDKNERLKAAESEQIQKAHSAIADETLTFLHDDLQRQDSFENAKVVQFSFRENNMAIDGENYFSASSKVYLKNSLLSGFLFAAANNSKFRHPRLLILDTLEDKGMEPARSQNFQRLLVKQSLLASANHQVIFATAMIDPELNTPEYVVGEYSTHDKRTLAIK